MMARRFQVTVDGHRYEVEVSELPDTAPALVEPALRAPAPAPAVWGAAHAREGLAAGPRQASAGTIAAPLPGVALEVRVAVGDSVAAGDVLVILEAMKMENEITAAGAGTVETVHVVPGASVAAGDPLVTLG